MWLNLKMPKDHNNQLLLEYLKEEYKKEMRRQLKNINYKDINIIENIQIFHDLQTDYFKIGVNTKNINDKFKILEYGSYSNLPFNIISKTNVKILYLLKNLVNRS